MKNKKLLALAIAMLICAVLSVFASADSSENYVYDGANLLTPSEETALAQRLEGLSLAFSTQITVVTLKSTNGQSIDTLIEKIYDDEGLGYGNEHNGVLLLVSMYPREYRILSNGLAAEAIKAGDIDNISDDIVSYLSDGEYATAFDIFADKCEYYLDGHINGFPFNFAEKLLVALIIGVVSGVIVAFILKAQLKSVKRQNLAHEYIKEGSMVITRRSDIFLYRNITKTAKPSNDSSSGSRSSRNVGGGSF